MSLEKRVAKLEQVHGEDEQRVKFVFVILNGDKVSQENTDQAIRVYKEKFGDAGAINGIVTLECRAGIISTLVAGNRVELARLLHDSRDTIEKV